LGATIALAATSGLAIWVGRKLLQCIPIHLMQRLSGVVFLLIGLLAVEKILQMRGLV
jgi:putative Ca2+/H+ antiporter (TMEM165/GDT1 family)